MNCKAARYRGVQLVGFSQDGQGTAIGVISLLVGSVYLGLLAGCSDHRFCSTVAPLWKVGAFQAKAFYKSMGISVANLGPYTIHG